MRNHVSRPGFRQYGPSSPDRLAYVPGQKYTPDELERIASTMLLEDWQRDWTYELLRVDEDGNFVYREALLGIARKNGKSALCSALALFILFNCSIAFFCSCGEMNESPLRPPTRLTLT